MTKPCELIFRCSMDDESECENAGPELLSALGYDFSTWKDEETKKIRHTLYFTTVGAARTAKEELERRLPEFASFGVVFKKPVLSELKKEDWAESWKIHFKPMLVSERLAVAPSWEKFTPAPGQHLITLDPGMSFGTGRHATTRFCLSALDQFISGFKAAGKHPLAVLDAGSGSGILSIAAWKLGADTVDAFDIDPDTLETARENARLNNVPDAALSLAALPLLDFQPAHGYDIVAANILSGALVAGREKLLSCCKNGGFLILAGILDTEYENVRAAFESTGMCAQLFSAKEKEWRGGAFAVTKQTSQTIAATDENVSAKVF